MIRRIARQLYVWADPVNIALYRLRHPNVGPVPPAVNRMRVGSRAIGRFLEAGRNCYRPLRTAIDTHCRGQTAGTRILDFGCGVGRVLRNFTGQGFELFACDVDNTAISYIARAYPEVQSSISRYLPPLAYARDYFDIVYSVSIWTHLPGELQEPWLNEIKRVLKPNGLALLTTIGPYGYRKGTHLTGVDFSLEQLVEAGFRYSPYRHKHGIPGVSSSFGGAYHTPEYIRKEWGKVFDVLDVQEGVIDDLNELVILRKRSSS